MARRAPRLHSGGDCDSPTGLEDADGLPTFALGPARTVGRLPPCSRLDLGFDQVFNFSTRRLTLFAEVVNVTSHVSAGLAGGFLFAC